MNWIDLYVEEVGRHLWMRGRKDIEAELGSTLQDMLEDRSRKAGRPIDDEMMLDLLREYGPPDKVAATYDPHPYLIGPRIFPFFLRVLKIVLASLSLALLIGLGMRVGTQGLAGPELSGAIVETIASLITGAMQAFGYVVLTFVILERVLPASEFKLDDEGKAWDPRSLQRAPGTEPVRLWEPIAAIVLTTAALVIFNLYPQVIGTNFLRDGTWVSMPALTEAFFRWLPYINVVWALEIAVNFIVLRQGRWQPATRWASVALDAAGIVIGYFLLAGPPIVSLSAEALAASGVTDPASAASINAAFQLGARVVIAIVMVVQTVEVATHVARSILRRR